MLRHDKKSSATELRRLRSKLKDSNTALKNKSFYNSMVKDGYINSLGNINNIPAPSCENDYANQDYLSKLQYKDMNTPSNTNRNRPLTEITNSTPKRQNSLNYRDNIASDKIQQMFWSKEQKLINNLNKISIPDSSNISKPVYQNILTESILCDNEDPYKEYNTRNVSNCNIRTA